MPHRHNRRLSQKKRLQRNKRHGTNQQPYGCTTLAVSRELRALIQVLVIAGIIAPYEQFIRLYESPNIINSAVAIVVLTGKTKVVAINWSVGINAAGTAAYKIKGRNLPLGPIFFRESSKTGEHIGKRGKKLRHQKDNPAIVSRHP